MLKDISNSTLFSIFQASNIGLCVLDKNFHILEYDTLFSEIFHCNDSEYIAKAFEELFFEKKTYNNLFFTDSTELKSEIFSKIDTFVDTYNNTLLCKFSLQSLGKEGYIFSIQNVQYSDTLQKYSQELKELQKSKQFYLNAYIEKNELLRTKDSLLINQSKLAAMGEMIGAIAHQWKQPLARINSILVEMQRFFPHDKEEAKELDKRLDNIEDLTYYMADTIENFRNFITPNPETKKEDFDFLEVLQSAQKIFLSTLSSKIEINFNIQVPKKVKIFGHRKDFIQTLLIFFNNSKDAFLQNNIEQKYIKISTKQIQETKMIKIEDNAGGIKEDVLEKIFEPYYSTKKEKGGTGLGLYMAKLLIEEGMNGKIKVKSINNITEVTIFIFGIEGGR